MGPTFLTDRRIPPPKNHPASRKDLEDYSQKIAILAEEEKNERRRERWVAWALERWLKIERRDDE